MAGNAQGKTQRDICAQNMCGYGYTLKIWLMTDGVTGEGALKYPGEDPKRSICAQHMSTYGRNSESGIHLLGSCSRVVHPPERVEQPEEARRDGEEDDLPVPVPDARQAQGQHGDQQEDGVQGGERPHL